MERAIQAVPLLQIIFRPRIKAYELPAFRGAVADKVGREHEWFHNHDNSEGEGSRYHYRYPLVQYRRFEGRPGLLLLGEGVHQAMHFFAQADWSVSFTRDDKRLEVAEMKRHEGQIGLAGRRQRYRLQDYLAFNQKNYEAYQRAKGLRERAALLEKALVGHVLSMATGLGFRFPQRFELALTDILGQHTVSLSGNKMLAFELEFEADAELPPMAGLGRGVSRGFGTLSVV